jgi:hypothetical protein
MTSVSPRACRAVSCILLNAQSVLRIHVEPCSLLGALGGHAEYQLDGKGLKESLMLSIYLSGPFNSIDTNNVQLGALQILGEGSTAKP